MTTNERWNRIEQRFEEVKANTQANGTPDEYRELITRIIGKINDAQKLGQIYATVNSLFVNGGTAYSAPDCDYDYVDEILSTRGRLTNDERLTLNILDGVNETVLAVGRLKAVTTAFAEAFTICPSGANWREVQTRQEYFCNLFSTLQGLVYEVEEHIKEADEDGAEWIAHNRAQRAAERASSGAQRTAKEKGHAEQDAPETPARGL